MRTPSLVEINAFVAVAEHASFSKAATHLGISASTVSMSIRSLEDRLGTRLLNRTTRSVALTEMGERLLSHLRQMLVDYDAAIEAISEHAGSPAGMIRLHVRASISELVLEPLLAQFFAKYPKIKIDVCTDILATDLVGGHFDAGIAIHNHIARDMVAIRISEDHKSVTVGSPDYLAAHGYPKTPKDLKSHNCIRYRDPRGDLNPWRMVHKDKIVEMPVDGSLIHNHFTATIRAAVNGVGLARGPEMFVVQHLKDGRLIQVLPEWTMSYGGYYIYYPSRRHVPAHLRALIDFLKANFEAGRGDKVRLADKPAGEPMATVRRAAPR